ncbi:4-(cytidine 5'-diphospho)-2-C-methyl-D-erythritol kinase [Arthrobacter sedimenti]|uniref:4-(cytidine 5'-diphospho)-2-C-methyl-D-erythritol kinase n=1 Tax=Arthrobacter sedimenti TaxID=2694931 RepID=UPI000B35DB21|nr:4-(cytidine 5'-diphospho)-2-C-methyl-D-erythritol kinase [Arthrobacter sedimenti]OUM40880.1 4-(cytidine 5'-diphospho)-2-C-methyl-D-erythritol kinase [Arthrobacter agilis]
MVSGRTVDIRSGARSVRVKAPGKINVTLKVGPPREDGYHGIASVFLAVSLYEEVTATETAGSGISVTVNGQGTLNLPVDSIPLDRTNLAVRAAELLADVSPGRTGVHLDITKRVPISGGMGGGSADAAAALLACDALWGSGFSRDELAKIAVDLGADVPFALVGGTAVGLGVGDQLTPAISKTPLHWVLVTSDYGLSTPEVYRTLDEIRLRDGVDADPQPSIDPAILGAMRAGDALGLAPLLHNDLEQASLELAPGLGDILDRGKAAGALAGIVSGSGPTIAFLTQSSGHAAELETLLESEGLQAASVHGPAHGARITKDFAG